MEDEQSTAPQEEAQADNPAEDQILSALSDTEDASTPVEDVVETSEEEVSETEAEPEAELTTEDTEELQPEVDPKEEARLRYEERQRARAERAQRVEAVSEAHISEATDEYDERVRAIEARDYARTVEQTENTLVNEFERAKTDPNLQIFNPDNRDEFNQRAFDKAMRDYNAGYIQYDSNGLMVGTKGSLIEHLTETAELLQGAVKTGAVQQVRATNRMRSNADVKPAATPKEAPKKDAILDILMSD